MPDGVTIRHRLIWAAVLVVICVGGAGLATAADRPQTEQFRPELTRQANRRAEPWLTSLVERLRTADEEVVELSSAAGRVLIDVQLLRFDDVGETLEAGDAASARLAETIAELESLRTSGSAGIELWRLGDAQRERLSDIEAAIRASAELDATWTEVARTADLAGLLAGAIRRHDSLIQDALQAGIESRWRGAVALLEEAAGIRAEALSARDLLAPPEGTPTFDAWLRGQEAQDDALLALYSHIAQTGDTEGPEVDRLRAAVDASRAPVPTDEVTFSAIITEAAGSLLAEKLHTIEEARGAIAAALGTEDAAEDEEEGSAG